MLEHYEIIDLIYSPVVSLETLSSIIYPVTNLPCIKNSSYYY